MQKLKITIFTDRRPGHEKQTQGIVKALRNYVSLQINECVVQRNNIIQELIDYLGFFLPRVNYSCVGDAPDLIIGTGSRTHIPILSYKKKCGARAVVSMAPNRLLLRYFDLCLIPVHDQIAHAENIFQTVGPPNLGCNESRHNDRRGLILVGGVDSKSHHWDQDEIVSYIKELTVSNKDTNWTIASSPRTPAETERKIDKLAEDRSNVNFWAFSDTSPGWIERQYGENKMVWITGDSISMVYEALSAGCRVGILPVRWKIQNNKFQFSERFLLDHKRVITFSDWHNGTAHWSEGNPLNEADRCAREILGRWWPKNLR